MVSERPEKRQGEIYDIKTLSGQTKIRMVLEIFDLGKDKEKNQERKNHFLELIQRYQKSSTETKIRAEEVNKRMINESDKERARLHNEIMDILQKISLSRGLSPNQRKLTEVLAGDREMVEEMIRSYFLGKGLNPEQQNTILYQARKGESWFVSPPGKEKEEE